MILTAEIVTPVANNRYMWDPRFFRHCSLNTFNTTAWIKWNILWLKNTFVFVLYFIGYWRYLIIYINIGFVNKLTHFYIDVRGWKFDYSELPCHQISRLQSDLREIIGSSKLLSIKVFWEKTGLYCMYYISKLRWILKAKKNCTDSYYIAKCQND